MGADEVIYNVPLSLWANYRQRFTILRAADAGALAAALRDADRQRIVSVQIISPGDDPDLAATDFCSLPVDLLLVDVEKEFPNLYHWAGIMAEGPARVSIPVAAGFGKALKLAASLGFAVKIEPRQPGAAGIGELLQALDLYLHRPGVGQPIEFFHSLLLACYHDQPASLWAIQEEDPAEYCYVTDEGEETLSRRLAGGRGEIGEIGEARSFLERFTAALPGECRECEHFGRCAGYFKWPDPAYPCAGIRSLFGEIRSASEELRRDSAAFSAGQGAAGL